jgi:hypothetical protein
MGRWKWSNNRMARYTGSGNKNQGKEKEIMGILLLVGLLYTAPPYVKLKARRGETERGSWGDVETPLPFKYKTSLVPPPRSLFDRTSSYQVSNPRIIPTTSFVVLSHHQQTTITMSPCSCSSCSCSNDCNGCSCSTCGVCISLSKTKA